MKRRREVKPEGLSDHKVSRCRSGQGGTSASRMDGAEDSSTRHTRGEPSAARQTPNNPTTRSKKRQGKTGGRKGKDKGKMYCPPLSEQGSGVLANLPGCSMWASSSVNTQTTSSGSCSHAGESRGDRTYNDWKTACSKGRNKSKGKKKRQFSNSQTSEETCCKTFNSADPPEIPGMYYDKVRKRYFQILSSGSAIGGGITRETIAAKHAEEQRQKDLATLSGSKSVELATVVKSRIVKNSLPCRLAHHHMGRMESLRFKRTIHRDMVGSLQLQGSMVIFEDPQGEQEYVEHMRQMESTEDGSQLLALWSVRGTMMQRMQLLTINHKAPGSRRAAPPDADSSWSPTGSRASQRSLVPSSSISQSTVTGKNSKTDSSVSTLPLKVDPRGMTVLQSWNKITNVCWAPFPQFSGKKYVLYTTMCHAGYVYSLAFIRNLDPDARNEVCYFDFNLGKRTTWTCAWDQHHQRFSVGVEKSCLVIDTMSRRLWEYPTQGSDPLCQTFDHAKGQLLYNGIRRGQVLLLDLRTSSRNHCRIVSGNSPIASLKLSRDDLYLYTSDFSGVVRKWDVRMRHSVLEFADYHNQYSRLPLHLSHDESLLYAVGQDSYSCFWDTQSGRCLMRLPPPKPANMDFLPTVQYHPHWAGPSGSPGLVMGLQNKLYLYSGLSSPDALEA